jgi:hypothetical protein
MKQQGKCIVGNPISVDSFTSDWMTIRLHPGVFYRRQEAFHTTLDSIKGLYAEIDMGEFILLKFSDKDDVTKFHRNHHEYI